METAFSVFVLVGISAFCWLMVVNPSARRRFGEPPFTFFRMRMSKEDRAMADGAAIAIYLVGALLFSIITIFAFVVAMSRWLKG